MSDSIQPLPLPDPAKAPVRAHRWRYWLLFAGLVLLILIGLFLYLLNGTTVLDGARRALRYRGSTEIRFDYELSSLQSAAGTEDIIALCDQSKVLLCQQDGTQLGSVNRNLHTPVLQAVDDYLLLHDVGGNEVLLLDADAQILSEPEISGQILDASLSEVGRYALLSSNEAANSLLEVYYSDGTLLFRRTAKSHYLNACALSPNGTQVAAVLMEQQNVTFTSTIQIFRTDMEEPVASVQTAMGLVFDLAFLDNNTLCAVGLYGLSFLSADGTLMATYSFQNAGLMGYSISGGKIALALDTYDLSARYHLVLLDCNGQTLAECALTGSVTSVSLCQRYVSVLGDTQVQVFTTALESIATVQTDHSYSMVQVRRDGTAFLLGEQQAVLLIPD